MDWTYRKILELAPNSLILEKARGLTASRHWPEIASDGHRLWGYCKSSGERLYQVAASLGDNTFRCDCRERHNPCRHILALLLRFVKSNESIPILNIAPAWVEALLRQPARPSHTPESKVQKQAEQERRFGQRLQLMQQGIKDLELWLFDLIQQGFSTAENQPETFWERFAARMVDAKLGGIARRIRTFKAIMATEQWNSRLLGEIGMLYLFVQSFKQLEELPEPLQEEVASLAGVSKKKEEVLLQNGLADNWLVIGQLEGESEEDKLRYRRTWLLGEHSRRMALLLDFAWGRQGYEANWVVGAILRGEAVFYPGAYPLRALIRKASVHYQPLHGFAGYQTLAGFAQAYAGALAANPWLQAFPCLLEKVWPFRESGRWWVRDEAHTCVPLAESGEGSWKLLALSGGRPIQLFGEWDGDALLPLSVISNERVVPLQEVDAGLDNLPTDLF